jgi:hypothetical protein
MAPHLCGQAVESAQIAGVVKDPSGSVIVKASVIATDSDTDVSRSTVSSADGTYVLVNLSPGNYRLRISAPGFKAYSQTGIVLSVGATATVPVVLSVGEVSQEVSVTADAAMVQMEDTSTSQVVSNKDVLELPLNGREITSLVTLSGGAANASTVGDLVSTKTYGSTDIAGSTAISIAGGQANGVNYVLDGGDNNAAYSNVNLPLPFPDAVDEFSAQTNGLSARYGLHPGGTVNVVTKGGSNRFHGGVFEFVRNGALDASNYFSKSQDTLERNQFGGTMGGPILHNRLFFFGGYQGTRITSTPQDSISYVPTQQVLTGDFSQFESAACQSSGVAKTLKNPSTGLPYTSNFISPSSFSAPAVSILKGLPVSTNGCGEVVYGVPNIEDEDQYIGRIDWTKGQRQSVFGRYFISHLNNPPPPLTNLLFTGRAGLDDLSQSLTLGHTYTVSTTLVNALHITGTKLTINRNLPSNTPNPVTEGINVSTVVPNFLYMTVPSFFSLGCGSCAPGIWAGDAIQAADDVDKMLGRNHLSFGFNWIYDQLNYSNSYLGNGEWTFSGQSTGSALADFMLGIPSTFVQANAVVAYPRQTYIGAYAQDDLKLSSRLVVHAGVRWEPFLPAADKQSEIDHFSSANFAADKVSNEFTNAPPGEVFPGDPGIPRSYADHKFTDFEPRIGVAWDPTGTGKQSIRSSYSIFYDYPELNYSTHPGQGAPWGSTVTLSSPADGLTAPYTGYPGGNPFPTPVPPPSTVSFVHYGTYYDIPLGLKPTYVQDWSLSYQLQLSPNWLLTTTYLGDKSTHLWIGTEENPATYIPGTCGTSACSTVANENQRRVLYLENPTGGSYYSTIARSDDGANAGYNGLMISANHRTSHHYTILANFTYSHCISEGNFVGELTGPSYQNPSDRDADRGNCQFDHREIANLAVVASMPRLGNQWVRSIVSDWQIAPIISVQSGGWFSPTTGTDNSLTGVGLDRPNVVGSAYERNLTTHLWLNPSGFTPNPLGTFGDAGAFSLEGPAYFDIDTALSRLFVVHNEQVIEARFEAFNTLNNVNYANPTAAENSANFGKILTSNSPRILQFAMKYNF